MRMEKININYIWISSWKDICILSALHRKRWIRCRAAMYFEFLCLRLIRKAPEHRPTFFPPLEQSSRILSWIFYLREEDLHSNQHKIFRCSRLRQLHKAASTLCYSIGKQSSNWLILWPYQQNTLPCRTYTLWLVLLAEQYGVPGWECLQNWSIVSHAIIIAYYWFLAYIWQFLPILPIQRSLPLAICRLYELMHAYS